MFYLIIAFAMILYYVFVAPKSIKGTLNMIIIVGVIACLIVLSILSFIKLIQSPPEIFVGAAMVPIGILAVRDVLYLPKIPKNKK